MIEKGNRTSSSLASIERANEIKNILKDDWGVLFRGGSHYDTIKVEDNKIFALVTNQAMNEQGAIWEFVERVTVVIIPMNTDT